MKRLLIIFILLGGSLTYAQQLGTLTVEKIMRDPKWMGVAPSNIQWDDNSRNVYFNWNPEKADTDALYQIAIQKRLPEKVADIARQNLDRGAIVYSRDRSKAELNKSPIL